MRAASKFIPYARHVIDRSDINAVVRVLRSSSLTQGKTIQEFESRLAKFCGSKYAVVCSSGTAALHLSLLSLDLSQIDRVITSPLSFVATANCALYSGVIPEFADIDPETKCISQNTVSDLLQKKPSRGKTVLIPVHFAGHPADMTALGKFKSKNCFIVEDASHALGASYRDHKGKWHRIGSARHSNLCVFSFHAIKSITTGEGGAILTNHRDLYERLLDLRTHGIVKDSERWQVGDAGFTDGTANSWYYEMQDLGFNYRLTDIQSSLGISQLSKLPAFLKKRRCIANLYARLLCGIDGIRLPVEQKNYRSAWHLYPLEIDFKRFKMTRQALMDQMKKEGIQTQVHYIPIYKQPFYQLVLQKNGKGLLNTEQFYERALSLPLHCALTDKDVKRIVEVLLKCLKKK